MDVVAVSVGRPETIRWKGRELTTAIHKRPVEGPVAVGPEGLDGDRQADPSVHGGPWKAVYAYPLEHYAWWRARLARDAGPEASRVLGTVARPAPAAFGENLTVRGLDESVAIGDALRVGTALLAVTEPRFPCVKLAAKFAHPGMLATFLASGRSGFYLRVLEPGEVRAGDPIRIERRDPHGVRVSDLVGLYRGDEVEAALVDRVLAHPGIRPVWRERFERRTRGSATGGEG